MTTLPIPSINRCPVRRLGLLLTAVATLWAAGCSTYSKVRQTQRARDLAVTAEQVQVAQALGARRTKPLEQLGGYLDAANDARRRLAADPEDTLLRSDYNFAVARVIDIMARDKLTPWDQPVVAPSADGTPWRLRLKPPFKQEQYHPRHFQFTPSDRYKFTGVNVGDRVLKAGVGAPLIVVGKELDYVKLDRFAQGRQVYYGLTAVIQFRGRDCEIQLFDPLDTEDVRLGARTYPLAGDFQGPLALALADLDFKKSELLGLFKPQEFLEEARISRLQPFQPGKIPVLCVHGLGNSPATWAPLVEFLRGDPEIRENYQFWFFSYPSGLPYPMAAAQLRRQLGEIRHRYPQLRDVVVIGHSMGGMISRLLLTDSGMNLWDTYFDQPPDQLAVSPRTRAFLTGSLIFKPTPGIGRVIFVAPSHRGSRKAADFWGRLGAWVVGNPLGAGDEYNEALAAARPEAQKRGHGRLPNSFDILNPDSLFLDKVDGLPVRSDVPFHTILGDRGKGGHLDRTKPESTDGFVPYWSGHLEGARSERVIPSGHWSHQHPLGMAEIKRILLEHLGH